MKAYPSELLPKPSYKLIDTDALPSNSNLIRKSASKDIEQRRKVRVTDICADRKDLFGLSCSLYGKFLSKHFYYKVTDKLQTQNWQPGSKTLASDEIQWEPEEFTASFYIPIFKLHHQRFPYEKTIQQVTTPFTGTIQVEHVPTVSNFWHFEIHVYAENESEPINRNKAKEWQKKAAEDFLKLTFKEIVDKDEPVKIEFTSDLFVEDIVSK